ncbi:hypothetical protein Aab01nite_54380 [Paractinoplanes abujensis]|uniref:DUF1918 domain-containing protein n=1 Tax=Paractinoplanes abujensis TaxID=882441 RepID=A0A7W7CRQ9_9ACTN|nr:DUF1918 domain-containing protein [Actinoplanes abujensis]MBB4693492.1 hypothetical protein [Actinoplanes abujensis]GID21848.1 hypothetical protein Aab01nite_54380 [Actinoplanes abujensis]
MFAQVGDRIVVDGIHHEGDRRAGVITAVRHADGAPPYEVRWLDDGRKSLIFPGDEAEIEHSSPTGSKV